MTTTHLDDTVKVEDEIEMGHDNHQAKTKVDLEDPTALINVANDQQLVEDGADEYPSVTRRTIIVVGVALALFCVGIDLVNWPQSQLHSPHPAFFLPRHRAHRLVRVVVLPGTGLLPTLLVTGKAYQYFPLKYTFILAVFIFEVGSLVAGVAPSSTVLIIGRAITGVGGAGIATGGYAILTVVARSELRPIFTGLVTTVYSIANVVGPIMGGAFAEHASWRWCFYINLPFGGVSGIIIFFFFRSPKTSRPKELVPLREKLSHLDFLGITLALGSLICFTRALQIAGTTTSWSSSEVIGLLVGFVLLMISFIISQRILSDRAMMVRKILKMRVVVIGMVFGFLHEGGFFTLLYALPIYFQAVSDVSPAQAGVRNIPLLLSCGIGSTVAGFVVSRYRHFVPLMVWASAGGCIGTGLIYLLDANSPSAQWIGYQVLAGLAFGTGLPLAIIAGQAHVSNEDLPSATAMLLCKSILYDLFLIQTSNQISLNPFTVTFNVGAALSLAAAQSMLDNLLLSNLPTLAPTVDPEAVIQAGATEIRSTFAADAVPGIVAAYLKGLRAVYILVIAFTGAAAIAAATNRWERLSLKK
ncbi:MAG: hypothetical protein Q9216_006533 [Gyalolechia sp. 2 TL-2023]